MASTILVQKLASVKLSKGEFEKIRWLRANNTEKMSKAVLSLRKILKNQEHKKTCRLCLKPGCRKIFNNQEFDIVAAIKQILHIYRYFFLFRRAKALQGVIDIIKKASISGAWRRNAARGESPLPRQVEALREKHLRAVTENDGKPQHICRPCEVVLRKAELLRQTAEVTQWRLQQELEMVTCMASDCERERNSSQHGGYFVKRGTTVTREWACGKCRQTFYSQEEFIAHENLPTCRSSNKFFVCETCGLELKSITRLKRHRLIHTGELHYPCTHCPYRARTKYALLVHERAHSGVRPLACPHCPATFLNSSNLASHKRRHMPPAYHCQMCEKGFRFKEALQNHLATQHSTAKPHICNSCGKSFSTRKMICRHERRVHNRPRLRPGIIPTYLRQQQEQLM